MQGLASRVNNIIMGGDLALSLWGPKIISL